MKATDYSNPYELYIPNVKPAYTLSTKDYASLKEKEHFWNDRQNNPHLDYCRIDSDIQYKALYKVLSGKPNCIFRGIKDAKHKIYTSAQVHSILKKTSIEPRQFVTNEIIALKKANGGLLPRYFEALGVDETDFLYLSLLQHYSAKTPFLDFSYSLDKALFFAQDKYKYCLFGNDISKYVSIYWIDLEEMGFEFIDTIRWYADQLKQALDCIINIYSQDPNINLDVSNLNWENFLSWCSPNNRNEGFKCIELGYITDRRPQSGHKITKIEYNNIITQFVKNVKMCQLTSGSSLYNQYHNELYNAIIQNVKLTNLNITAQEGCFLLYNPENNLVPLEDYWSHNITYQYVPTLHCIDINKKLIRSQILPQLKKMNITHDTMYPLEEKIVSGVV